MKTILAVMPFGLILCISLSVFGADFPIRSSNNWDQDPVVIYNSTDNQYLVVWSEFAPIGNDLYIIGPVMGQRLTANGKPLGSAFQIFDMATSPSVAYNSKANEYLVAVRWTGGVHGQRINSTGGKVAGDVLLMSNADYPQVLYNDLTNEYFLAAYVYTTPHRNVYLRRMGAELQVLYPTKDAKVWDDSTFNIVYAPIGAKGRYLLSDWSQGHQLLDSEGNLIQSIGLVTGYPDGGYVDGEGYAGMNGINAVVDVAFGYKDGSPVFMVVWADINNKWPWPEVPGVTNLMCGVWGGYIDAINPPSQVANSFFPIEDIQLVRWCYARWKPKVVYNPVAKKFIVAWNETPTNAVGNDAKVNHIRATSEFKNTTGFVNVVLSNKISAADPDYPVIASSTKNASALVVWEDKRNKASTDIDIYGNLFTTTPAQAIILDVPNGGESWAASTPHIIVWRNQNFSGPVKLEYSTDGGATYTIIAASTANTGSYTWNVPNTPSTQCRVRVSDAADGNPSDVSDSNFEITTTESIILDVPNGGENWVVGTPHFIVWHSHLYNGSVKIEYSKDNGASYTTIAGSVANSGSYQWTIPNTLSSNCLVKVSDPTDGVPSDVSNATFTISASAGNNTQTGSNVEVDLGSGVKVTFDNVSGAGNTTLNAKTSGPPPPGGFTIVPSGTPIYYSITTTATHSGNIKICIQYNDTGMTPAQEAALKLQVYESTPGQWKDITTSVDVNNNIICGLVSHLSDFAVMVPTGGPVSQTISLSQGWSWISFNVQPADLSIEKVMAGVPHLKIVVNGAGQFYIPNVINNIGQINVLDGYKVYVDATDQVSVTGQAVSANTPISLVSGWNFVAYLPASPMSAENALASCISSLAIVKNAAGGFFIPNVINSLGNMKSGEGYKLYMNAAATLTYP